MVWRYRRHLRLLEARYDGRVGGWESRVGRTSQTRGRKSGGPQVMGCSVFLGLGQSKLSCMSESSTQQNIWAGIASLFLGANVIVWLLEWAREWKAWCGASREARDPLVSSNSGTAKSRTNESLLRKSASPFGPFRFPSACRGPEWVGRRKGENPRRGRHQQEAPFWGKNSTGTRNKP